MTSHIKTSQRLIQLHVLGNSNVKVKVIIQNIVIKWQC